MMTTSKVDKTRFQLAPEIRSQSWLNGAPTSLAEQRGRVVLVTFWTFDCINCQNVMPSLKELYRKYNDKGLTMIGVHSPEFAFEHDLSNVQQAIQRFGLPYLIAQDNDFANWNAYRNHYWPSLYLIDKEGYIRYNHIGEGDYEKIDAAVRQLLNET